MDAPLIELNFMNDMHNDHWKIAIHIMYTLSDLDLYITTLSELCLKGIIWKVSPYNFICVAFG
jgi:hypothetical protein